MVLSVSSFLVKGASFSSGFGFLKEKSPIFLPCFVHLKPYFQ
jgi:hypothetical protein